MTKTQTRGPGANKKGYNMDEIYYNSNSRGRIPVSDMCDEHVRRAFKKLLREQQEDGQIVYTIVLDSKGRFNYERTS